MKLTVPEEVWVFAKGPSFDYVDWDKVGKFRATINDMAFIIDPISMMFANDTAMQDILLVRTSGPLMVTRNNRLRFPYHLQHDAEGHGTAGYAINVLSDLGARKFHMIGFDSFHGNYSYSKLFKDDPQIARVSDGMMEYILRVRDERKLDLIFYGGDT